MKPYPSDVKGISIVHGENMENSGKCRARQDGLVDIINAHEEKYRGQ